ncbi:jg21710, partial [Pararge aegeria aegeria]
MEAEEQPTAPSAPVVAKEANPEVKEES